MILPAPPPNIQRNDSTPDNTQHPTGPTEVTVEKLTQEAETAPRQDERKETKLKHQVQHPSKDENNPQMNDFMRHVGKLHDNFQSQKEHGTRNNIRIDVKHQRPKNERNTNILYDEINNLFYMLLQEGVQILTNNTNNSEKLTLENEQTRLNDPMDYERYCNDIRRDKYNNMRYTIKIRSEEKFSHIKRRIFTTLTEEQIYLYPTSLEGTRKCNIGWLF